MNVHPLHEINLKLFSSDRLIKELERRKVSASRAETQRWRDDAFEAAAKIAERYSAFEAAKDIRAMISFAVNGISGL